MENKVNPTEQNHKYHDIDCLLTVGQVQEILGDRDKRHGRYAAKMIVAGMNFRMHNNKWMCAKSDLQSYIASWRKKAQ